MFYQELIGLCTLATVFSIGAVWRVTRRRKPLVPETQDGRVRQHVPVSILKPLRGADDALDQNLDSFFNLDYQDHEIVFGVEGDRDPAIEVVRRLRRKYPSIKTRLVVHNGGRGLNPKVSNLLNMIDAGTHDVVLISDSNVSVGPGYLKEMTTLLQSGNTGLVTNLVAGTDEHSIGAAMENLQLNGPVAAVVALSEMFGGRTLVVGKSMMFRRSVLERLGGLNAVANLLAEDYIIGKMFRMAGYDVRLCRTPVRNVCRRTTVREFVRRNLRWSLLRSRLKPFVYPLELIGNPVAVALVAPVFEVPSFWPMVWALSMILARDSFQTLMLRGRGNLAFILPLGLAKDLIMLFVWAAAPFCRHVAWRGHRLRISAGTLLYAGEPMDEAGMIRVEG
ncbi:MAG: glycosyltransferase [Deltaproteobacteria bacterium]|nr:glycosyltransferase [Deltaproteobacteria bacterium]